MNSGNPRIFHGWPGPNLAKVERLALYLSSGGFLWFLTISLAAISHLKPGAIHHPGWQVWPLIPLGLSYFAFLAIIFIFPAQSLWILGSFLMLSAGVIGSFILSFAIAYTGLGLIGPNGKSISDLPTTLYFSVITWTTVGYGDIQPSEGARGFASIEAIIGSIVMSLFLSGLIACLSKKSK